MSTTKLTAKDTAQRIVENQPDDCTLEEIIRELAFHCMIERGLADVEAGRTISHDEMKRQVETWLKSVA